MSSKHDGGWRCLDSRYLFESKWFNLRQDDVRLPDDADITYTLVEHPGYALIVPVMEDGNVILEQVYRYTVKETVLECPSGGLDDDEPLVAAHRELREETGYRAKEMVSMGSFYGSNGISNEECHAFIATGLSLEGPPILENTEQIELVFMPLETAYKKAIRGEIKDAPSALALILAWNQLNNGDNNPC